MIGVDIIGPLYDMTDPEDPVRVWGFHVNVTPAVIEAYPALTSKVHQPETLRRVWSGDDPSNPTETVALRFNGENAAREALGDLWPHDTLPQTSPAGPAPL